MPGQLVDLAEVVALRLQCVKCKNSVPFRFPLYQEVTLPACENCPVEKTFSLPNPDPWMKLVSKTAKDIDLLREAQIEKPRQFRLLFEIAARHNLPGPPHTAAELFTSPDMASRTLPPGSCFSGMPAMADKFTC